MLYSIQTANQELNKDRNINNLAVWSMDAEALFPSLGLADILKGIWRLITESEIQFNNLNISEISKYLAITYSKEEITKHGIEGCIPVRQIILDGTQRSEPTLAYLDSDVYTRVENGEKNRNTAKWVWTEVKIPTKKQRKIMVALALMEATKTLLQNHVYCFNGKLYRQKHGGPIGDNVTMIASGLVMYEFAIGFKQRLVRLSLYSDILFIKIYVDDLNMAGECLPYGT